ncbi:magnesium-translocating P-type ATPase [Christensenella intestinihominis]|uniref:magnesium-translocating P-type ATPase n=1 Tax=Christensenella intestinihominis TaxID=1851429 RepID=UPI00082A1EE5|nr:magnesium-translocating P-type ATPase [Christensenella intestinihominis]
MEKVLQANKARNRKVKISAEELRKKEVTQRMRYAATAEENALLNKLGTTTDGISVDLVAGAREQFGDNTVQHGKKESLSARLVKAFINPFTLILLCLATVSFFMDVMMADPGEADPMTVIIIMAMVGISGILRFAQETRSGNAAENLLKMIKTTTCAQRLGMGKKEIPLGEVVVGDIIYLSAGDMIPADLRILRAKDLFLSQSSLTGESEPVEKTAEPCREKYGALTAYPNLAFMGSDVISGSATGVVVATGGDTVFGEMAQGVAEKPVQTSFEKGVNSVSWVLIRFMLVMVPIVLFINGFTKGNWMEALLFAISVAVGLTPEMLPMVVTTCLAKGAVAMSKEKTIIKNLNAIQNLGSIDILCTDKTGTLTQDKVVLEYHLNIHGEDDVRVLRHGFLNSYFQTGLKNLMDKAIIRRTKEEAEEDKQLAGLTTFYTKVDEIPFDFERRRMSVVVKDIYGKTQMITKGAVEEMLSICSHAEYEGKAIALSKEIKRYILEKVDALNNDGMRVIAVAQKTNPSPVGAFSVEDEKDMVLIGYLAFLDPPKESTAKAVRALREHGVAVKVLTGDNDKVTRCICRQVGIQANEMLLGDDIDAMTDSQLAERAQRISVFAKLSPAQKARIISVLRDAGHSVGYMGDGINDAAAMKASDAGISVDTAVDIAKESASVVLLEKDLMVLEKGIVEGRKTYANMIKYIKMTASSNFGNMFSVLVASAFLPFMPMMSIHLILLNLIYDLSCTAIPWDNVDKEFLAAPRKWDASSIGKFMVCIGPTSSVFDITTYLLMYFVICPMMCGGLLFHQITDPATQALYIAIFQAGWFVESMWSQTLVIHMIRTPKIPFIQSHASAPLTLLTFTGIAALTVIPFTPFGSMIGLAALPPVYFAWLALTIACYMVLATVAKKLFVRKYGELL